VAALTAPTQLMSLRYATVAAVLVVVAIRRPLAPLLGLFQPKKVLGSSTSLVQVKRHAYEQACASSATKQDIQATLTDWFLPPPRTGTTDSATLENAQPRLCNFTFLDFGANNGDSMGKFIDAGIVPCPHHRHARYNIDSGRVELLDVIANNYVTPWSRERMLLKSQQVGYQLNPEDYCYYGIEGNPVFTKKLQQMEHVVLQSTPSPLKSAHFYTETVAVAKDGPTQLFLETHGGNYWGSSIYATHKTVQKSAHTDHHAPTVANVTGLTLTTLAKATTLMVAGNHLLLKIDIEGAEYPVLDEAYASGILCDYAKASVQVDLLIEIHKPVRASILRLGTLESGSDLAASSIVLLLTFLFHS
jgi:Methyltransferase FkbM domain